MKTLDKNPNLERILRTMNDTLLIFLAAGTIPGFAQLAHVSKHFVLQPFTRAGAR